MLQITTEIQKFSAEFGLIVYAYAANVRSMAPSVMMLGSRVIFKRWVEASCTMNESWKAAVGRD